MGGWVSIVSEYDEWMGASCEQDKFPKVQILTLGSVKPAVCVCEAGEQSLPQLDHDALR